MPAGLTEAFAALAKAGGSAWQVNGGVRFRLADGAQLADRVLDDLATALNADRSAAVLPRRDLDCLTPLSVCESPRATLVCVHAAHGDVYDYRHLAAALDGHWAVYGIHALRLLTSTNPPTSIEQMAEAYSDELSSSGICAGRCVLFGASAGGLVALEIAQRLAQRGRAPELLVLGDTLDGGGVAAWVRTILRDRFQAVVRERFLWMSFISAYLPHDLFSVFGQWSHAFWQTTDVRARAQLLIDAVRDVPDATHLLPLQPDVFARQVDVHATFIHCYRNYRAMPYAGRTLYLKATESTWEGSEFLRSCLRGKVEEIAGGHITLLRPEGAHPIAAILARELGVDAVAS